MKPNQIERQMIPFFADGLVIVWIIKFISSAFAQIDHKNIKTKEWRKKHIRIQPPNNDWAISENNASLPIQIIVIKNVLCHLVG